MCDWVSILYRNYFVHIFVKNADYLSSLAKKNNAWKNKLFNAIETLIYYKQKINSKNIGLMILIF